MVPVKGEGQDVMTVSLNYQYCKHGENGVCKFGSVVFTLPLNVAASGNPGSPTLRHVVEP